ISLVAAIFRPQLRLHFFFLHDPPTPVIYTLSLHDALPISFPTTSTPRVPWPRSLISRAMPIPPWTKANSGRATWTRHSNFWSHRSEEHTSELQSPCNLVCRLLLEKKKKRIKRVPLNLDLSN